jgi:uncharacterized DUF497 family protein
MPHLFVFWDDGDDGNIAHLAEHGVRTEEAEYVLRHPIDMDESRSSGRPIAFGYTRNGRKLAVVFERIDKLTVYPITAYDVED